MHAASMSDSSAISNDDIAISVLSPSLSPQAAEAASAYNVLTPTGIVCSAGTHNPLFVGCSTTPGTTGSIETHYIISRSEPNSDTEDETANVGIFGVLDDGNGEAEGDVVALTTRLLTSRSIRVNSSVTPDERTSGTTGLKSYQRLSRVSDGSHEGTHDHAELLPENDENVTPNIHLMNQDKVR
jgi:hypothetical protein